MEIKTIKKEGRSLSYECTMTLLIDGVERVATAWNTDDDYDFYFEKPEDQEWYNALTESDDEADNEKADEVYEAVLAEFNRGPETN